MKDVAFCFLVFLFSLLCRLTSNPFRNGLVYFIRGVYGSPRLGNQEENTVTFRDDVKDQTHLVTVGDRVVMAQFVHIWSDGGLTTGNDVMMASHCAITTMTHETGAQYFDETDVKKSGIIDHNE